MPIELCRKDFFLIDGTAVSVVLSSERLLLIILQQERLAVGFLSKMEEWQSSFIEKRRLAVFIIFLIQSFQRLAIISFASSSRWNECIRLVRLDNQSN